MSWRFEPEDFKDWHKWENPTDEPSVAEVVSQMANAKLDAEREKMPVVYGYSHLSKNHDGEWSEQPSAGMDLKARLCDIEEIKS